MLLAHLLVLAAPLVFEENRGAIDDRARYVARGEGLDVFLLRGEVRVQLRGPGGVRAGLAFELERANVTEPEGLDVQPATHTRFIGGRVTARARLFASARYAQVYDGIDWRVHAAGANLELDFALAAFADPAAIRLRVRGARLVALTPQGARYDVGGVRFELRAPRAFQDGRAIEVRYVRRGDTLGFVLGAYDRRRPVLIDPVVATYFGYLGASGDDSVTAVALTDDAGFAVVAGNTTSLDFPAQLGFRSTNAGGVDVFITKLDPRTGAHVFSTYIGGAKRDTVNDLALEADGTVVVVGDTLSGDFPVTVSGRPYDGGVNTEGFVVRLAPTGDALRYSSFLGGGGDDEARAVKIDGAGTAWVGGLTRSNFFNGFVGVPSVLPFAGGADGFAVRLMPDAGVGFFTYLGGSGNDQIDAVALDTASAEVWVAGSTDSLDLPTSGNAYQKTISRSSRDGMLARLTDNPTGIPVLTYLGSDGGDSITDLAIAPDHSLYVVGTSNDTVSLCSTDALNRRSTGQDGFLLKLAPGAVAVSWAAALGGSGQDFATAVAVDARGLVYITGHGPSDLAPGVTPQAIVANRPDTLRNGFFGIVDRNGTQFLYLTYVGGTGSDTVADLAVTPGGLAVVGGFTNSDDLPVAGPVSRRDGGEDAMLFTFVLPALTVAGVTFDAGTVDGGVRVDVNGDYFLPDASVWFGEARATVLPPLSQTVLRTLTPAHSAGPVDVVVVNPDGRSVTLPGAFVFIGGPPDAGPAPVARLEPPSLTVDAGVRVVLDGSGSTGVAPLTFTFRQVDGPTAVDFDAGGSALEFVPSRPGLYAFELVVTDPSARASAPARSEVTVLGAPDPLPSFRPGCACSQASLPLGLLVALLLRRRLRESSR